MDLCLCVNKSNYLTSYQLYYTPGHLNTFIGVNYADKIDPKKHDGLKASATELQYDVCLPCP